MSCSCIKKQLDRSHLILGTIHAKTLCEASLKVCFGLSENRRISKFDAMVWGSLIILFMGVFLDTPQKLNCDKNINIQSILDKQQEVDINNLRLAEEEYGQGLGKTKIGGGKGAAPLSQISGVKKPLGHTNSFSGSSLPKYGVDPKGQHEAELAKVKVFI